MIDTPGTGLIGIAILFTLLLCGGRIGAVLGLVVGYLKSVTALKHPLGRRQRDAEL